MWKKRLFIITLIAALALPVVVSAQDSLIVWNALAPDNSSTLANAGGFGVQLEEVEAPLLLDTALSADQGSVPDPDVIVADQLTASTLFDYGMISPVSGGEFFLLSLLADLPDLFAERCPDESVQSCLWPGASSALPLETPQDHHVDYLLTWLCQSAETLPQCSGAAWPGVPVSWGFTILLFNADWLAQNGIETPYNLETARDVRNQYKMNFVEADRGFLPSAGDLSPDEIYVVDAALLVDDPDGVMDSLTSFFQAGYVPVFSLTIDSAYVGAFAANPGAAAQYAFALDDPAIKSELFDRSDRLPAFYGGDVWNVGVNSDEGEALLRALTLLIAYAALG